MRISKNPKDPGYFDDGREYIVLFNGQEQTVERTGRAVHTADEDRGMIMFVVWNGEALQFEEGKLYGHVRLNRVFTWEEAVRRGR